MKEEMKLWNNFNVARKEDWGTKPLHIPYGKWPWSKTISQQFDKTGATATKERLDEMIKAGEPGIPVYQGHPDVESVAAKYPDKAAIGWIKKIDVNEDGIDCWVEWDRFPGKGFGWMSPYWTGEWNATEKTLTVNWIISMGLVNDPNIRSFRLPNEGQAGCTTQKKEIKMDIEAMKTELGLPPEATETEVMEAIKSLKAKAETVAAAEAKAAAAENACGETKTKLDNAEKELGEIKTKLDNAEKELGETKTALANEQAEVEKLRKVKTESVTTELPNEQVPDSTEGKREKALALVNELQVTKGLTFDQAFAKVEAEKPDLFK